MSWLEFSLAFQLIEATVQDSRRDPKLISHQAKTSTGAWPCSMFRRFTSIQTVKSNKLHDLLQLIVFVNIFVDKLKEESNTAGKSSVCLDCGHHKDVPESVFCNFYGLDVHSLQIKMYCCKSDHIPDDRTACID
jgi:hypothetical protein